MEESASEETSRNEFALACSEGNYTRARELLAIGADPCTSRAGYFNWSALHFTARQGQLDFAQMLINQYGCHPMVEDKEGRTPLHIACQYGQLEFARYLIKQKRCDAEYADIEDQTPLHHTCGWLSECTENEALVVCRFLIGSAKCDPNGRDSSGRNAVLHACEKGFLSVLRFLVEDRHCNLSVMDYKQNNALHLAVSFSNNLDVVDYIISRKELDIMSVNNRGNNILHLAAIANSSIEICKFLLQSCDLQALFDAKNEDGAMALDLAKPQLFSFLLSRFQVKDESFYKKYIALLGLKPLTNSEVRVFVLGDARSGKTTFVQSLQKESTLSFSSSFSRSLTVHSPTLPTSPHAMYEAHRLEVTQHESKFYGQVSFYDFHDAGCHVGILREAMLKHLIHPRLSLFVIVLDIRKSLNEIEFSLNYWLSLLSRCCAEKFEPKVILVGSHADVIGKASKDVFKSVSINSSSILSSHRSYKVVARLPMDCRKSDHPNMHVIRKQLVALCGEIDTKVKIPFNAHCLFSYINSRFEFGIAVTVQSLQSSISSYSLSDSVDDVRHFLADDTAILFRLLEDLSRAGHIILLRNSDSIARSLIVTDIGGLYSELGRFWHMDATSLLNEHNLVPVSNLTLLHLDHDTAMILELLSHFELCTCARRAGLSYEQSDMFFFPFLLTNAKSKEVWDIRGRYEFSFGWRVDAGIGDNEDDVFSLWFVGKIFLQCFSIAASFAEGDLKRISLWKNGIHVISGVEPIFEAVIGMSDDLKSIVLIMRSTKFDPSVLKFRSSIIKSIRSGIQEHSRYSVTAREYFIDPFDTFLYPIPPRKKLTSFSLGEVCRNIARGSAVVRSHDQSVAIALVDLLFYEPYSSLGAECLAMLGRLQAPDDLIPHSFFKLAAETLCSSANTKCDIFCSLFGFSDNGSAGDVDSLLRSWSENNGRTCRSLVQLLNQFSLISLHQLISQT